MAKVLTKGRSRTSYLRRLSVVFADELRLKIVAELFMREMSPKQFHAEFGGGSLTRVDRHFQKLVEHRWLRLIRTESGKGRRRGGHEHFYRATEPAVFDRDTWSAMPYSLRVAISWRTFKQLAERVQEALHAGTFDARDDSHLSWTPLLLDEQGWERIVAAVDELFESLFEEQGDARLRMFKTGELPMPATVALAVFESPARARRPGRDDRGADLAPGDPSPLPFTRRLAKVFADPLSLKILAEANLRETSAPQFQREFEPDTVQNVRRRFKMLEEVGWLRKVREETGGRRRSAVEHFYRATGPAIFDNESWAEVPDSVKPVHSWTTFMQLTEQVKEAIDAGTFEARLDNHLSWSLLRLDRLGWEKVAAQVDALFALVLKEKDRAGERIESSGEAPITTTVALAAFESPKDFVRTG